LNRFLRLDLCFSVFSGWVWPEMKNVTGDGECRCWRGEGELEKKTHKKKKKNWVFCSHFIFLEMVRCQHVNGGQKTPPFCPIHIAAAL
jgi:hypothetical protein